MTAPPPSSATSSDESLLSRYRSGESAAFEILYARHRQGLYRFLLGLSGKAELAEEVYQDTWLSLIRSTSQPQGRANFRTWLVPDCPQSTDRSLAQTRNS